MSLTDNTARWNENIRVIEAALHGPRNNGMELFVLCAALVDNDAVRRAAPLAISVLSEAVDRYRRNNGGKTNA